MSLTHSFQSQMLKCIESFSFFVEGKTYYCMYDNGGHFYIWCSQESIPVNQIKLSEECRKYFKCSY